MLGLRGPSLPEPATLGLRHRLAAERVLTHQSGRLELLLDGRERRRGCRLFFPFGNLAGEGHDEPQAVLQVVQLHLGHEPCPVEIRMLPHDPRQRLAESHLEIGHPQRCQEELRRVDSTASLEMGKSRVSQGPERGRERLRVTRLVRRLDREFGGGDDEVALKRPCEALRHRAAIILQQREVGLRDAEAHCCLLLGPALSPPRLTQPVSVHLVWSLQP